jgi:hypothetical protein
MSNLASQGARLESNGVIKWPEQPGISFAAFRFTPARPPDQREFRFDLGVGLQASGISMRKA